MNKIIYSPDAIEKLEFIKRDVAKRFDSDTAQKAVKEIVTSINRLKKNALLGVLVSEQYDIDTHFRKLFAAHNHIFYEVDSSIVRVIDIYNEREDFLYKLFDISSIDEEAEKYWDEVERNRMSDQ